MIRITDAHRDARLATTQGLIDAGTTGGVVELYDSPQPAALGTVPTAPPCATIKLAKPCGVIDAGALKLSQKDVAGDMVALDSSDTGVKWALVRSSAGDIVMDATVSDNAAGATGDFKLSGSSGTRLFAGGYVLIGDFRLR